jgi:hypothetical protein
MRALLAIGFLLAAAQTTAVAKDTYLPRDVIAAGLTAF